MHRISVWTVAATVALGIGLTGRAEARVTTRTVSWKADGQRFEGTVAFDAAQLKAAGGKLPGVLVIHQWMGPTDYERMRAGMLAELGYVAFVGDVYGVAVRPTDQASAGKAAGRYKGDRPLFRKRVVASLAQLRAQPEVDKDKIAAVGYCFGGTGVLELARSGADIRGVVSFHGGLDSPDPAAGKRIKAKITVLHGAADPFVKAADIAAFRAELDAAKVDWQMVLYSGAVHAFTQEGAGNDPSKGAAYNASADRRSWGVMRSFLAEVLL